MTNKVHTNMRNLFEMDNARNMSPEDLLNTFVTTETFWRLLSPKNQVVLGSRGSGKTALTKMLSHDHLSKLNDERAKQIVSEKTLIGIFLPTCMEWVGALYNKPWLDCKEKDELFVWNINVSSCIALLATIKSCIACYIADESKKILTEVALCEKLSYKWTNNSEVINNFVDLESYMLELQDEKRHEISKCKILNQPLTRSVGDYFYNEIFTQIKMAIHYTKILLNLPAGTTWMILIDEAEFLDESHYKIINSCMRSDSKELIFKLTTMPYHHKTLSTNIGLPLNEGHDFEYVYIDEEPTAWIINTHNPGYFFSTSLFNKRAIGTLNDRSITLGKLLGESSLLYGRKPTKKKFSKVLELIDMHCTQSVKKYAKLLFTEDIKRFDSAIYRKMYGFLRLRDEVVNTKGRGQLKAYSGYQMVIRCGDGNPRKMIRLFNLLIAEYLKKRETIKSDSVLLSPSDQCRIVKEFSASLLDVLQNDTTAGEDLYPFITKIGEFFKHKFLSEKLSTNTYYSVRTHKDIDETDWIYIKYLVGLGLLYPNMNPNKPNKLPWKAGVFRLSYALAPHFSLFPRRAEAKPLNLILQSTPNQPVRRGGIGIQQQNFLSLLERGSDV